MARQPPLFWNYLYRSLKTKFDFDKFDVPIQRLAHTIDRASKSSLQIKPLTVSQGDLGLTQAQAYEVAAAVCSLRQVTGKGNRPIGRKIGFTNKSIWPEYNIDQSNWGYMYQSTVRKASKTKTLHLQGHAPRLEPKIEPEIVFGIGRPMTTSMTSSQLIQCIEWVAHGFEVVQSIYPHWKFTAADTTAAGALHRCLIVGERMFLNHSNRSEVLANLEDFEVDLFRNGELMETGKGRNVLGSPIRALYHLNEILEAQDLHPLVQPGEVITTGTLTKAFAISNGDEWTTSLRGINLEGLQVKMNFKDVMSDSETEDAEPVIVRRYKL